MRNVPPTEPFAVALKEKFAHSVASHCVHPRRVHDDAECRELCASPAEIMFCARRTSDRPFFPT